MEASPSHRHGCEVVARARDGSTVTARARFLLDASGRNAFIASRRRLRVMTPTLRKAAVFAHYQGVVRAAGRDAGDIVLILLRDGWFWMIPLPDEWPDFIHSDKAFFASEGGDANVGGRLPAMYRRAGLDLVEVTPTIKIARPGDAAWSWMTTYFMGVMDRYAGPAPFTKAKSARLKRQWAAAEAEPTSLMIAPTVLDVVGRRR